MAMALVDWNQAKSLKEDVGAEDFLDVYDVFLEELSETLDAFAAAPQPKEAAELCHAIKGCAANLGFIKLSQLAGEFEQSGTTPDVQPQLADLFAKSKIEFESGLDQKL